MQTVQVYSIAAGGLFLGLVILQGLPVIHKVLEWLQIVLSKYLIYTTIIRRRRFVGPWSPAAVLMQILYLAVNLFVLTFRAQSFHDGATRAGTLTIVNMAPLVFGPHHSFLADLLGLSLRTYRCMHRSVGVMSSSLVSLYTLDIIQDSLSSASATPTGLPFIIVCI